STPRLGVNGVWPRLPSPPGALDAARLAGLVQKSLDPATPPAADTYWTGKELGRLVTLSPIARQAGQSTIADQIETRLESTLSGYFTAPGKSDHLYYYDSNWGTL